MERLTNHFDYCDFIECRYRNAELAKKNQCDFFNMTSRKKCHDKLIYEKLREYEDAEEQGLLLRLPCKVGDTVYCFTPFCEICEETLDNEFSCEDCNKGSFVSENKFDYEMIRMFGRSIFLTKEEAEQALAKMKEV